MNRKYSNNWDDIMAAPDEIFEACAEQFSVQELIDQKTHGYVIPSSVLCIMRVQNLKTNKVAEHVYQQRLAAQKRLARELENDDPIEITILSETSSMSCRTTILSSTILTMEMLDDLNAEQYSEWIIDGELVEEEAEIIGYKS